MGVELIPRELLARYRFEERGHATAILQSDFRQEFNEVLDALRAFKLRRSDILTPGGGRSPIPIFIDGFLGRVGWGEKSFDIKITVDANPVNSLNVVSVERSGADDMILQSDSARSPR